MGRLRSHLGNRGQSGPIGANAAAGCSILWGANMELKYKGRTVSIHIVKAAPDSWDWSYVIHGVEARRHADVLARSEDVALECAFQTARKVIDRLSEEDND